MNVNEINSIYCLNVFLLLQWRIDGLLDTPLPPPPPPRPPPTPKKKSNNPKNTTIR